MPQPTVTFIGVSDPADNTNSEAVGAASWVSGDEIIILGGTEDQSFTMNTPTVTGLTGTGLTFSAKTGLPTTTANSCKGYGWRAIATGTGSGTITVPSTAIGRHVALAWKVDAGTSTGGSGTPAVATTTAKTVSLTRTGANSAVLTVLFDWSADTDVTVTSSPAGGTQRLAANIPPGIYTAFSFDWANEGAAGTTSYGVANASGTGTLTKIAVEIPGTAGGGTPTGSAITTAGASSAATGRRVGQRAPVTPAGAASVTVARRKSLGTAASSAAAASTAAGTAGPVETHSGAATSSSGSTSVASGRRVARSAPVSTAAAGALASGRRLSPSSHEEASPVPPFTTIVAGALTGAAASSQATGTASTTETHSGVALTAAGATSSATGRRKALSAPVSTAGAASVASGRRVSRATPVTTAAAGSATTARRISRGSCATTAAASSSASGTSSAVPTRNGAATTSGAAASAASGRRVSRGTCANTSAAASTVGWRRTSRGACLTSAGAASAAVGGLPGAVTLRYHPLPSGTARAARSGAASTSRAGTASRPRTGAAS